MALTSDPISCSVATLLPSVPSPPGDPREEEIHRFELVWRLTKPASIADDPFDMIPFVDPFAATQSHLACLTCNGSQDSAKKKNNNNAKYLSAVAQNDEIDNCPVICMDHTWSCHSGVIVAHLYIDLERPGASINTLPVRFWGKSWHSPGPRYVCQDKTLGRPLHIKRGDIHQLQSIPVRLTLNRQVVIPIPGLEYHRQRCGSERVRWSWQIKFDAIVIKSNAKVRDIMKK